MSDDDDDAPIAFVRPRASAMEAVVGDGCADVADARTNSKRKRIVKALSDEGEADGVKTEPLADEDESDGGKTEVEDKGAKDTTEEEDDEEEEEPRPIGKAVRVSGKGRSRKEHFEAFEYDGNRYELEDAVLLTPEEKDLKPYVAIIKDIAQAKDGSMTVTGQWFYRPEEAEKKGGGNWKSCDTRELFYSFHRDEVPAESVFHRCAVYFVPRNKQLPCRKQHPGFIVQKVYDTVEKKLWRLTDVDYEDNKQHEIDLLVQKSLSCLGDLPDIEPDEFNPDVEEPQLKRQRSFRKRNVSPVDVSRDEEAAIQQSKAETPGGGLRSASAYIAILAKFNALTGDTHRDKCMDKLLQGVQHVCDSESSKKDSDKCPGGPNETEEENKDIKPLIWPDDAVSAISSLEKASHEAFSSDCQKYNQKIRQLLFNLKNNAFLARRFVSGELEPSNILNMSPNELKDGLMAEETAAKEPVEAKQIQMTDSICERCREFKVGVKDIIHGGHGDRYQLECTSCGHSWFSSMDAVSMLTINGPGEATSVGAAPLATAKVEDIEKQLNSPRSESGKPSAANDALEESAEAASEPALERQESMGCNEPTPNLKPTDEGSEASKTGEQMPPSV